MAKRRIFDAEGYAQFVTFSCFRRRRLLDHPRVRDEFVKSTAEKLREHHGICCGFVVMPNHVHAIAGLVARVADWRWSSAGVYESGVDAGVPLEWIFET